MLSKKNIFVSRGIQRKAIRKSSIVIPCGVDTKLFREFSRRKARNYFGFNEEDIILFAGQFDRQVKNPKLALEIADNLNIKIIELKNYTRKEVFLLLNSVDLLLMTSYSEGSPQIIKEAMACNCPIVSTDVGDVKSLTSDVEGCYISTFAPANVAKKINNVFKYNKRTKGRKNS